MRKDATPVLQHRYAEIEQNKRLYLERNTLKLESRYIYLIKRIHYDMKIGYVFMEA